MISARQIVPLSLLATLGRKGRHQQHLSKSPRMDYASLVKKKLPMKLATVSMCLNMLIS